MRDHNKSNLGMIAGVAAFSAAAGALAASLMTPKSGHEIRSNIKDKAHDARDKAKERVSKVKKDSEEES